MLKRTSPLPTDNMYRTEYKVYISDSNSKIQPRTRHSPLPLQNIYSVNGLGVLLCTLIVKPRLQASAYTKCVQFTRSWRTSYKICRSEQAMYKY